MLNRTAIFAFLLISFAALTAEAQWTHTARPVQRVDRWLGVGYGHGYHWRNPGMDSSWYNPWSPHNSNLYSVDHGSPWQTTPLLSDPWQSGAPSFGPAPSSPPATAPTPARTHPASGPDPVYPVDDRDLGAHAPGMYPRSAARYGGLSPLRLPESRRY